MDLVGCGEYSWYELLLLLWWDLMRLCLGKWFRFLASTTLTLVTEGARVEGLCMEQHAGTHGA